MMWAIFMKFGRVPTTERIFRGGAIGGAMIASGRLAARPGSRPDGDDDPRALCARRTQPRCADPEGALAAGRHPCPGPDRPPRTLRAGAPTVRQLGPRG